MTEYITMSDQELYNFYSRQHEYLKEGLNIDANIVQSKLSCPEYRKRIARYWPNIEPEWKDLTSKQRHSANHLYQMLRGKEDLILKDKTKSKSKSEQTNYDLIQILRIKVLNLEEKVQFQTERGDDIMARILSYLQK